MQLSARTYRLVGVVRLRNLGAATQITDQEPGAIRAMDLVVAARAVAVDKIIVSLTNRVLLQVLQ
jgi:hypothetical protein